MNNPAAPKERPGAGADQSQSEVYIHASAIAIKESGVLIMGPSGAGKSSLTLALIAAAETAGYFARLVGDDRIRLENRGGRLIARGHSLILGRIERRGQGIFDLPFLPAAVVRFVIDLAPAENAPQRYPEPDEADITLAGVRLPLLHLPQGAAASDLALSALQIFFPSSETGMTPYKKDRII